MNKPPLKTILEAEKRAQDHVKNAGIEADKMKREAERRITQTRMEGIRKFDERSERSLENIRSKSSEESGRIKMEGVEMANELKEKVRIRIPEISERIVEWYLTETK